MLESVLEVLGDRKIVLAKELTKIHETFIRGTVSEILENIETIKGEFVILVEGSEVSSKEINKKKLGELSLEEHYEMYETQGFAKKEIIKKIAKDRGTNKNEVYQYFLDK